MQRLVWNNKIATYLQSDKHTSAPTILLPKLDTQISVLARHQSCYVNIRIPTHRQWCGRNERKTEISRKKINKIKMNESVINVSGGTTRREFIVLLDMPRIPISRRFVWRTTHTHQIRSPCVYVNDANKRANKRTSDNDDPTNEDNNVEAMKIRRSKQRRRHKEEEEEEKIMKRYES